GGAGADDFVFDNAAYSGATAASPHTSVVTDYDHGNGSTYSAAEGDQIDISALVTSAYGSGQAAKALVRGFDNLDGNGVTMQVDTDGTGSAAHWVTIANLTGIHQADVVNVILSSSQPGGTTLAVQGSYGPLGDFNGDGKADILWRNDNGTNA